MRIVNPTGKKGEDLAVQFLKKKGWKILERNYRQQYGEIDIIAIDPGKPSTSSGKKEPVLVFVEVKTRTSNAFGTPFEAITSWKLKPLLKTAELYVASHKNLPEAQRIDAIAVQNNTIEHIENIDASF